MAKNKRVIFDTGIWISRLINGDIAFLKKVITNKNFTVIYSIQLLAEIETVCLRPKFRKWFDEEIASDLIKLIINSCEHINYSRNYGK